MAEAEVTGPGVLTHVSQGRPLEEASAIAQRFVDLVAGYATRILIAGSIRRKRPRPNDIDIVGISKVVNASVEAYFAPIRVQKSLLHERVNELIRTGAAKPRVKSDGKIMVGELVAFLEFEGMALDLYYASEETWWGLVQMRTGSAPFNASIATRALSMGLRFHGDGKGVTKDGVRIDDGKSEEGIFRALGMAYLAPEDRN